MDEHESKVARAGIFVAAILLLALAILIYQIGQWEHEEKMKKIDVDNDHPAVWRK